MMWQLAFPRADEPRERERGRERKPKAEATFLYNLISRVTYHHVCYSAGHKDQCWYNEREAMHRCEYQEAGILEATSKAGYHALFGKERSGEEGHALKKLMV